MKKFVLLCIAIFITGILFAQSKMDRAVDLKSIKPNETIMEGETIKQTNDKEQFFNTMKSALKASREKGVLFKDSLGRIFTNGYYKFQFDIETNEENPSHIEYRINQTPSFIRYETPIPLTEEGNFRLGVKGVDMVGNEEPENSYNITVDKTPPEIFPQLIGISFQIGDTTYYKSGVKLDVKAIDKGSGLNLIILNTNEEGNLPLPQEAPVYTKGGDYSLSIRALDNVYNLSKKIVVNFSIDDKKPSVNAKTNPPLMKIKDMNFCKKDSKVVLEAEDLESGINRVEYSLDGVTWKDYRNDLNVGTVPDFKVKYRAIDNSENESETKEFSCKVDSKPPVTVIKVTSN